MSENQEERFKEFRSLLAEHGLENVIFSSGELFMEKINELEARLKRLESLFIVGSEKDGNVR